MNKKLLAVAVAGALAAPAVAFAQASSVQIYGRANLGIDGWQATGSQAGASQDLKNRTRIYDTGSRLGFRGVEDLGGGLKALMVMESGVSMDSGSAVAQNAGVANASGGTLASRDSYVGLGGNWGDVRFGRQSIYWVGGVHNQSGANYINQEIGWYNGASLGRVAGPSARVSNVMSYNSPTWSGFNFTASYSPQSESAAAGADTNASIWGTTFRYEGPYLGAQWDHGDNQLATGAATRQHITADKLYVSWPYMPGARVGVVFNRTNNKNVTGQANFSRAGDNIDQGYWGLNWEHMMGNWQFLAMYSRLNSASGCNALNTNTNVAAGTNGCAGTESTAYMGAVKYYFSKRTGAYVSFNNMKNGFNQIADISGAAYSSSGTPVTLPLASAGADVKIWAIGMLHNF